MRSLYKGNKNLPELMSCKNVTVGVVNQRFLFTSLLYSYLTLSGRYNFGYLIITYVVKPCYLVLLRIRLDVTLEVHIVAFFDVLRIESAT